MRNNPTLLSLLEAGATVELPNEVKLTGLPETRYIRISFAGTRQGQWSLDHAGLASAIEDGEKIYAEYRGDDFTDITGKGKKRWIGGITIMTKKELMDWPGADIAPDPKLVGNVKAYNIVNEDGEWLWGCDDRAEIRREWDRRLDGSVLEYGNTIAVRYSNDTGGIYDSVDEAEDAIAMAVTNEAMGPHGTASAPVEIYELRGRGMQSERVRQLYIDASVTLRARP